jgi:hypothetical protein
MLPRLPANRDEAMMFISFQLAFHSKFQVRDNPVKRTLCQKPGHWVSEENRSGNLAHKKT